MKDKKEKKPVRKWVKWVWIAFWTVLIAPFVYGGYKVYKKEIPQFRIPFEKFISPKKEKDNSATLSLPYNTQDVFGAFEQYDVFQHPRTVAADNVMKNQNLKFVTKAVLSIGRKLKDGKEVDTAKIGLFYNDDYYAVLSLEKSGETIDVVSSEIVPSPEIPIPLDNRMFSTEMEDYLSKNKLGDDFSLKEIVIEAPKTTYRYQHENDIVVFHYDSLTQKVERGATHEN